MIRSLRRELLTLRWCAGAGPLLAFLVGTAAIRFVGRSENLSEITVERINVVDADGTLRMVIANKSRMPPVRINGQVLGNRNGVAGLMFYNDYGDENGGLIYKGGTSGASMSLTFDQYKQDQTLGLQYTQGENGRLAGMSIWDRPDAPITDYFVQLSRTERLVNATERAAAVAALDKRYPAPKRVFIGKSTDHAATVLLHDGTGRPRLRLKVEQNGEAAIEFLDEQGRVTRRIEPFDNGAPRRLQ
jgi:hypothetical protein